MIEQLNIFLSENIMVMATVSLIIGVFIFFITFEEDEEEVTKSAKWSFIGFIISVVMMLFVLLDIPLQSPIYICFAIHIISIYCIAIEQIRNCIILSGSILLIGSYIFTVGYFELYNIPLLIPICTIGLTYGIIKISMKFWIVDGVDGVYKKAIYQPNVEGEMHSYELSVSHKHTSDYYSSNLGCETKGSPKECLSMKRAIEWFRPLVPQEVYKDMIRGHDFVSQHQEEFCDLNHVKLSVISDVGIKFELSVDNEERDRYWNYSSKLRNSPSCYTWSN